jgi:hypothetical protein
MTRLAFLKPCWVSSIVALALVSQVLAGGDSSPMPDKGSAPKTGQDKTPPAGDSKLPRLADAPETKDVQIRLRWLWVYPPRQR